MARQRVTIGVPLRAFVEVVERSVKPPAPACHPLWRGAWMRDRTDLSVVEKSGVVVVRGECDAAAAPSLDKVLDGVGTSVVLDLQAVTFMDSSAVSVLVRHHQRLLMSGGRVSIIRASKQVVRVLELAGLTDLLGVPSDLGNGAPSAQVSRAC